MSDTKFTPGPWRLHRPENRILEIRGAEEEVVVHWQGFDAAGTSIPTTVANAHLLAAAPEMKEALELLYAWETDFYDVQDRAEKLGLPAIEYVGSSSYMDTWLETNIYGPVKAALRKARGEA